MRTIPASTVFMAICVFASGAAAQNSASKPTVEPKAVHLAGGASAISETHGSWTVNCQVVNNTKVCSSSFQQFDGKNQRIFAIELSPRGGEAFGSAALPFGLALAKGITLSIDEKPSGETHQFSTCILAGCLVPLTFNAAAVETLSLGTTLKIKASAIDTGQDVEFSVPLNGFSSALKRTRDLLAN